MRLADGTLLVPPALVRCSDCREALVLPGRSCSACHDQHKHKQKVLAQPSRPRPKRGASIVIPARPPVTESAMTRRVGQRDGRRWR